jgi:hypothetical protein
VSNECWLEHARTRCLGPADILTQLISRHASHKAKDSAFTDEASLIQTITTIAVLRDQLEEAKKRNVKLLSQLQEYEAREY